VTAARYTRRRLEDERGSVLALALAVMASLTIMGATMVSNVTSAIQQTDRSSAVSHATNAAEGAANVALSVEQRIDGTTTPPTSQPEPQQTNANMAGTDATWTLSAQYTAPGVYTVTAAGTATSMSGAGDAAIARTVTATETYRQDADGLWQADPHVLMAY